MFVHVADGRALRDILRGGIRLSRHDYSGYAPEGWPARYVFCVPVLPSFEATFQWVRELRLRASRCAAVQFRLPDDETVLVGAYWQAHRVGTAAEAAGVFLRAAPAARGMQVLVPRAVRPREIVRVRSVPQFVGWRHGPNRLPPRGWLKPPGVPRWEWRHVLKARYAEPGARKG